EEQRHLFGEVVLQREDLLARALNRLAAQLGTGRGADQRNAYPQASTRLGEGSLDQGADPQRAADAVGAHIGLLVGADAIPRDDLERLYLTQLVDQRFGETVGQKSQRISAALAAEVHHREVLRIEP